MVRDDRAINLEAMDHILLTSIGCVLVEEGKQVGVLEAGLESTLVRGQLSWFHGNVQPQHHLPRCHQLQFNTPNLLIAPTHKVASHPLQLGGEPLERVRVTVNHITGRLHHLTEAVQLQPKAFELEPLSTPVPCSAV
jgi:hypothetical protein